MTLLSLSSLLLFGLFFSKQHSSYYSSNPEDYYLPHDKGYSYPVPVYPPPPPQYPYPYPPPSGYGYVPEYHNPTIPRFRPRYEGGFDGGGGCMSYLLGFFSAIAIIVILKMGFRSPSDSYEPQDVHSYYYQEETPYYKKRSDHDRAIWRGSQRSSRDR